MKRLALAASLLVAAGCTPPDTDVAVSGELPERVVVRAQSVDMNGVWPTPATAPGATTTTTSAVPPTTVPPAPAPQVSHTPAGPSGNCGGWRSLVASLWPAEHVAKSCAVLLCESNGNPHAQNPSGASGLFQIMPLWADDFGRVTGLPYYDGRFNAAANATFARWLWGRSGWRPWVCA